MYKYFLFVILVLLIYFSFAEFFPTYKNINFCTKIFEENYSRIGLLDNTPSGPSGEKLCRRQKKQILNLEDCLAKSREADSFEGLTDFVFKLKLFFSTNLNSLNYEKQYYNRVCSQYPDLNFKLNH